MDLKLSRRASSKEHYTQSRAVYVLAHRVGSELIRLEPVAPLPLSLLLLAFSPESRIIYLVCGGCGLGKGVKAVVFPNLEDLKQKHIVRLVAKI